MIIIISNGLVMQSFQKQIEYGETKCDFIIKLQSTSLQILGTELNDDPNRRTLKVINKNTSYVTLRAMDSGGTKWEIIILGY